MFDWHIALGAASGCVQIYSIVPYIRDILKGTTRPNIISWFIWLVLAIIVVAGQISAGASWSLFLALAVAFNTSAVLIVAVNGYGYKKYGWVDLVCFIGAVGAIVAWAMTKNPVLAIVFVVLADLVSTIPTLLKICKEPFSELAFSWFLLSLAGVLAVISTTKFDIANLLYPGYTAGISFVIAGLAYYGQSKRKRSNYLSK